MLSVVFWAWLCAGPVAAQPCSPELPQVLSLEGAVVYSLQNNPELAAMRQQHGVDAAGIVIARTYPFNPTFDAKIMSAHGEGVTNPAPYEFAVLFELELRRQGVYRRQAAEAALSRTDWDIAAQEGALAVRVVRAYQTVHYRRDKLELIEKTVKFNEAVVEHAKRLLDGKKLSAADLILARAEVNSARSQLAVAKSNVAVATAELRRALGIVGGTLTIDGKLESRPCAVEELAPQVRAALAQRADLKSRQAAVLEAEARLRLARADRWGNPSIGPAYQFNEARVNFVGVQMAVPLAVLNTRRGEIEQRQAELSRKLFELEQTEVQVQQDVEAALTRLEKARSGLQLFETDVLPELRTASETIDKLFQDGDPTVDVLRMIDMRRKLLLATDAYYDALWEATQAQADLAAAVGDIGVACVLVANSCPEPLK